MINLPDLNWLQQNTSYTDIFRDTLLWNIGLYGMGVFVIFLIFLFLKLYQLKQKSRFDINRQSLLTYGRQSRQSETTQNRQSNVAIPESTSSISETQQKKKRDNRITLFDIINVVTSVTFYITLVAIAAIYLSFYAFGQLGHGTGHDVLAVIIMVTILVLPTLLWKVNTRPRNKKIMRGQIIFTTVMLVLWVGLSVFSVLALKGVCICVFNNKYGAKINGDFVFSTQFSRSLQIQKICKDDKVCHMYATLPENSSDSVFINVHTGTNVENLTVILQTPTNQQGYSEQMFNLTNKKPFRLTDIEYIARRNVFSFYFDQLKPDTLYNVIAKNAANDAILYSTNYTTLPNQDAQQLRLAVGGDVGIDDAASLLTGYLKSFNPHAIILGGDNAYDDGMRTCFYSWDNLYDIMDELNSELKRMVPLILTIGNHDVGFNALAGVPIDRKDYENLPYYFLFNPQHKSVGSSEVPEPKDRLSYHYHVLGPTVHVHLDSGYVEDFRTQSLFIEKIINNFPNHLKFANYHNPIYPSCTDSTDGSNDRLVIEQGLEHWTPYFDSGRFVAAFEHHTHHRKFTNKIRGNKVVNKTTQFGVRYVGDGSWGVPEDACPAGHVTKTPEYFQYFQTQHPNHVWKIKIVKQSQRNYTIQYNAIDSKNISVFRASDIV